MEEASVSYKVLRKIQQAEQGAAMLTKLDVTFYQDVRVYLQALDRSVASEKNLQKSRLFADELANTRKLVEAVYALREKKVVSAALVAARGGEPDVKNILEGERVLYERLLHEIREARQALLSGESSTPEVEPPVNSLSTEPAVGASVPEPVSVTAPVPSIVIESPGQANPHPLVRVVQDMPAFVGIDLRVYELHKDDVLTLPSEIAGPLLKRGVLVPIC